MEEHDLKQIITNYEIELRYVAFRYVRDWILVDDIMQEVYLKIFLKLNSFKNKSNIKTWLYKITCNQSIDCLRNKFTKSTVLLDNPEELLFSNSESVERELFEKLEKERLYQNINSLPNDYKQTLSLYYFDNYSYKEISDILCKDISYVKNKLFRGRRLLKKVYQKSELIV